MLTPYTIDSEILGGEPVFRNTRVPVKILFDYIEAGDNISGFLENYPSVNKDNVIEVLEISYKNLEKDYPLYVAEK
jgi:uncharacterized protein (DUF433 family)